MEAVVRDFGDRNPQEDPVIHFYEHFLAAYDKKQKVSRGVFYTPRPVVNFIVRGVDEILRATDAVERELGADPHGSTTSSSLISPATRRTGRTTAARPARDTSTSRTAITGFR